MAKPKYTKPTSQLDLEARQAKDFVNPSVLVKGVDGEPSDNGFIGVDPVYQNYANETDRPLLAEGGAESKLEKDYVTDDVDTTKGATPEGESEAEDKAEDEDKGTTPPSNSSSNPPAPSSSTPPSGSQPS